MFRKFNRKSVVEKIEDIEILRFFELNKKILMEKINTFPVAVDYPSDIKKVENILKKKFSGISIAKDNQEIVNNCDLIILAVRPQVAQQVLRPLEFKVNQKIY